MIFSKRRRARQQADREYEAAARVKHLDTTAERYSGGNTYSRADIEALENEILPWRRRKRRR